MSNLLYIDDSGPKQWETPYAKDFIYNPPSRDNDQNKNFWRRNYFVLGGVYTNSENIQKINNAIDKEKLRLFGTKNVEIHSSDIRNPHQLSKKYLQKYSITRENLADFINNFWYPILSSQNVSLIAIVIDKRYYDADYRKGNGNTPLEIAVKALFDRIKINPYENHKIIFDQMDSQIRTKRHDQGKIIQISDAEINLSDNAYKDKYNESRVQFEKSSNSNFLQLADTVAYNVWRQFVDYGDEWEKHDPNIHRELPTYPYFEYISNNFYHDQKTGRVSGQGIIKLPDPNNNELRFWKIDTK